MYVTYVCIYICNVCMDILFTDEYVPCKLASSPKAYNMQHETYTNLTWRMQINK